MILRVLFLLGLLNNLLNKVYLDEQDHLNSNVYLRIGWFTATHLWSGGGPYQCRCQCHCPYEWPLPYQWSLSDQWPLSHQWSLP